MSGPVSPSFAIDGFEPIERLGAGGFGVVWKAKQERIGRLVAVKVGNTRLESEQDQRFFNRECESMGRLSGCANIVQVYTSGYLDDGRPYLVLEYIEGGTLTDRLRAQTMTMTEILRLGLDLCQGLHHVHNVGVLHRDVKPDNVLVRHDGTAVLGDFGIAQLADSTKTQGQSVVGSLRYIAPVVLRGDHPSTASDIYGIGVTLYAACARESPYTKNSNLVDQVIHRILNEPLEDVSNWGFHPGINDLIQRLTYKNPDRRPVSTQVVSTELTALLTSAQTRSASPKPLVPPPGTTPAETETTTSRAPEPSQLNPTKVLANESSGSSEVGPGGTRVFNEQLSVTNVLPTTASAAPFDNSADQGGHSVNRQQHGQPVVGPTVFFAGNDHSTATQLANALANDWDRAIWELSQGPASLIHQELSTAADAWGSTQVRPLLSKFSNTDAQDRNVKLTEMLLALDHTIEPVYRGWKIGADELTTTATGIPVSVLSELKRREILVRWRHNPHMQNITHAVQRWEQSLAEYQQLRSKLGVQDERIPGQLLVAAIDPTATSQFKKSISSGPKSGIATSQAWWAALFHSSSPAAILMAGASIDRAVAAARTAEKVERKKQRSKTVRLWFMAAVGVATAAVIAMAATYAADVGNQFGPAANRRVLSQMWYLLFAPLVAFWLFLSTSKRFGFISGFLLASLAWVGWILAVSFVSGALADGSVDPRLGNGNSGTSSALGIFVSFAVPTIPTFMAMVHRRLTTLARRQTNMAKG